MTIARWRFLLWCFVGAGLLCWMTSCVALTTCSVGDRRSCVCASQAAGVQTCLADETGWTTCSCGGLFIEVLLTSTEQPPANGVLQIKVDGGASSGCVGAVGVEVDLQPDSSSGSIVRYTFASKSALKDDLLWSTDTGLCQLQNVRIPSIPLGGQRRVTLRFFDSSGRVISKGSIAESIPMDANAAAFKKTHTVSLVREPSVTLGTLILQFIDPHTLPAATRYVYLETASVEPGKEPFALASFRHTGSTPPTFVVFSGIPTGPNRSLRVIPLDDSFNTLGEWSEVYSLPVTLTGANASVRSTPKRK